MLRATTTTKFAEAFGRITEIARGSYGFLQYAARSDESVAYLRAAAKELDILAGNARGLARDMRAEAGELAAAQSRKRR